MINTAQLFCINDRIWYPINSPEFQSTGVALTASATLTAKKDITLSSSTFHSLPVDIHLVGVFLKTACVRIFCWRTPAKVWSNLKSRLPSNSTRDSLLIYFRVVETFFGWCLNFLYSRKWGPKEGAIGALRGLPSLLTPWPLPPQCKFPWEKAMKTVSFLPHI